MAATRGIRHLLHATSLGLLASIALSGCMMWMRDADYYEGAVTELLDDRSEAIAACYDRVLAAGDPAAGGEAVVHFTIEKKTGAITDVSVAAGAGGLAEGLDACIGEELAALRLDPPDAKTAEVTVTWRFVAGPPKRPPADPFLGAQPGLLACYDEHLRTVDREAQGALVIDYRFDGETGKVASLEVVADGTTAPAAVVACAKEVLAGAQVAPDKLEDRNLAGRRTFTLRYTPAPAL